MQSTVWNNDFSDFVHIFILIKHTHDKNEKKKRLWKYDPWTRTALKSHSLKLLFLERSAALLSYQQMGRSIHFAFTEGAINLPNLFCC